VVESQFAVADIGEQGGYTLYFSPLHDAPGRSYAWELAAADVGTPSGVSLCLDEQSAAALAIYGVDWAQVYGDEKNNDLFIAARQAPLPRAYVVYGAEVIPDAGEQIARLLDEQFDLRNRAVLSQDVGLPATPTASADAATVVEYRQRRVVLEGNAEQAGLLILGDAYHPGWRATLNGRPVPVIPTNYVQRGVLLPAGAYRIVFTFAPETLRYGALASALGLLLLAGLWFVDYRYQRASQQG
jgi:hypothetical protein